jgi:hypothetical protein
MSLDFCMGHSKWRRPCDYFRPFLLWFYAPMDGPDEIIMTDNRRQRTDFNDNLSAVEPSGCLQAVPPRPVV